MRMKILFVIPTLDRCGAEKQLTILASNLPKDRFDVRVAVLTRSGPYLQNLLGAGVHVYLIGKRGKISPRAYLKLKRIIREFRPDVVHTWLFAANAYGRAAAFACGVPVVICGERCSDPWKGRLHDIIDRKLAKRTDAFAVNSNGIVDFYANRGIDRNKFIVIPNAVDAQTELDDETRASLKAELLAELGLPATGARNYRYEKLFLFEEMAVSELPDPNNPPFLIGLVARLWSQKRVRDALWAADQLRFSLLNFYLVVIGDGPERDSLLRYREDLRLTDRVLFLGERNDVPKFMKAFDLLWNCSEYEGQSNAILEALSWGVPVMASDIPGNRDLIIPGENGLLISEFEGDATRRCTAWSRETIRLLKPENAGTLEAWRRAARERIIKDFSAKKMVESHAELYERLLAEKKR